MKVQTTGEGVMTGRLNSKCTKQQGTQGNAWLVVSALVTAGAYPWPEAGLPALPPGLLTTISNQAETASCERKKKKLMVR